MPPPDVRDIASAGVPARSATPGAEAQPATESAPACAPRPRERLFGGGPALLHDSEVLALLLGTGVAGAPAPALAARLLDAAGGLRALLARTPEELAALPGLGAARAARLLAAAELGRRALEQPLRRGLPFRSSRDVFRHFAPRLADLAVEQFHALLLDGKHRVLRDVLVSQGTLTSSPVHPREVFGCAMRHGAAAVVLLHNHPSGDPTPSSDDLDVTRRLCQVGELVGIRVLDHVVVGDGSYASLADRGLM